MIKFNIMNKVKLVLGDWSGDGHSVSNTYIFNTNKSVEEIQQAYKDSCKLTGIQFNDCKDYTRLGLNWDHPELKWRRICVDYEESTLHHKTIEVLKGFGINIEEHDTNCLHDSNFKRILIDFIRLSLPDLIIEEVEDGIPYINGFWNDNLNVQFGYGLYT